MQGFNPEIQQKSVIVVHGYFSDDFFDRRVPLGRNKIFILEGRPDFASSRATVKGFIKRKIRPTLIADNMSGFLFARGMVKEVWLTYQDADTQRALCLIGGLILAVLGLRHRVPVALVPAKKKIEFMGRDKDLFYCHQHRVAPAGIGAYVPRVEWVPSKYWTKIYD